MADEAPTDGDDWTTIRIRKSTRAKLKRIGGAARGADRTVDAIADTVIRERKVESVRRKILGVADALESGITGVIRPSVRDSPAKGSEFSGRISKTCR
jgi:hypothetical protein